MAEFAYNNANNANIGHMLFELNCGYHSCVSYKEDIDPQFKFKAVDKLSMELQEFILVCCNYLFYTQEL